MTAPTDKDVTPLQMAQTGAAFVAKVAELQTSDDPDVQIQMHINRTGKQAMDTAIVAGMMALVSIAETLPQLLGLMQREVEDP